MDHIYGYLMIFDGYIMDIVNDNIYGYLMIIFMDI